MNECHEFNAAQASQYTLPEVIIDHAFFPATPNTEVFSPSGVLGISQRSFFPESIETFPPFHGNLNSGSVE